MTTAMKNWKYHVARWGTLVCMAVTIGFSVGAIYEGAFPHAITLPLYAITFGIQYATFGVLFETGKPEGGGK